MEGVTGVDEVCLVPVQGKGQGGVYVTKEELQPRGIEPNMVEFACEYLDFADEKGSSMGSPHRSEEVMILTRKLVGTPTVSMHVLIVRLRTWLTGTTIMLSSLSQDIGSCCHVRSDSPRRMKMDSMPAAVVCLKCAMSAMLRYMSSSMYTRCGVAIGVPLELKMPRFTSSLIVLVRRGTEWVPESGTTASG